MQPLVHAIQELSRSRSVEEIAAIVRTAARSLTGADGATFILKEEDKCHYLDEDAIAPLWKGKRFPAAACISGWCMQHRQPVAVPDIYRDDRIPQDAYRPTFVKSLVMVPIRSSDPIGAIGNYWATPHAASRDEIAALQALADSTATAMENAYLHASMQRQIEERTRELTLAREQAENATALKSRFLAAASHNLRQPVQTLSAVVAILQRVDNREQWRAHVASMTQSIRNMESMLDTLLDLHRLDAGAIAPELQDTTLADVFARLRSEFAYVASAKSLSLEIPQAAPGVRTDPHLLQEILRNFLSNAIKYTARGEVRLECVERGDEVAITVADTGPGIPESHLSRIFEAFYRAPGAGIGPDIAGLGLGLSIVDQLARVLEHPVSVESRVGHGSRFSIALPRARAPVAVVVSPLAPQPAPRHGGEAILFIDDDPGVRESLALLLGMEGYDVAAFGNGDEALAAVRSGGCAPDIIISDFHLPAGDTGERVVQRVRDALGRRIPALLLTGETRETRAASPTDRILYKPVDVDLLLGEIASLLNAESGAAAAAQR